MLRLEGAENSSLSAALRVDVGKVKGVQRKELRVEVTFADAAIAGEMGYHWPC
jgi:hypothetical protein